MITEKWKVEKKGGRWLPNKNMTKSICGLKVIKWSHEKKQAILIISGFSQVK